MLLLPLAAQQEVRFSGEVRSGGRFQKDIGHGLLFVVASVGGPPGFAWEIEIRAAAPTGVAEDNPNYIGCVTPPYHGPNPAEILAWQFVDARKLGAPVESPLRKRAFQFALNAADNRKACKELNTASYSPSAKDPRTGGLVFGDPRYKPPALGTGLLRILDYDLEGVDIDRTRLPRVAFDVELVFPRAASGK